MSTRKQHSPVADPSASFSEKCPSIWSRRPVSRSYAKSRSARPLSGRRALSTPAGKTRTIIRRRRDRPDASGGHGRFRRPRLRERRKQSDAPLGLRPLVPRHLGGRDLLRFELAVSRGPHVPGQRLPREEGQEQRAEAPTTAQRGVPGHRLYCRWSPPGRPRSNFGRPTQSMLPNSLVDFHTGAASWVIPTRCLVIGKRWSGR